MCIDLSNTMPRSASFHPALRLSRLAIIAIGAPLLSLHARAQSQVQVYKCQVSGHQVFQSSPCAAEAPRPTLTPVSTVDASPASAASAPAKKKTLAEVLRERDGNHPQSAPREAQGDGANILRSRMGAV